MRFQKIPWDIVALGVVAGIVVNLRPVSDWPLLLMRHRPRRLRPSESEKRDYRFAISDDLDGK